MMAKRRIRRRIRRRERTAYHEAGHAIMARLLDCPTEYVTIERDADSLGHFQIPESWAALPVTVGPEDAIRAGYVSFDLDERHEAEYQAGRIDEEVMILLAGTEAECVLCGRVGATRCGDIENGGMADFREALRLANGARFVFEPMDDLDNERCAYFCWMRLRTRNILRRLWAAVDAVARALLERERLTGDEVAEIVDREKDSERFGCEFVGHDWVVVERQPSTDNA